MSGIVFSSMRVGQKYSLVNYREKNEFTLIEVLEGNDYQLKDIFSKETYLMSELIQYGKGEDFELLEIYD